VPRWLGLGYAAFLALWIPVYWRHNGLANFLWYCDFANFAVGLALWRKSALLLSSQAAGVLLLQLLWVVDFGTALLAGWHPIGGTEYMFDPQRPLLARLLSLFHVWMPLLLVWGVRRLGYDRRAWKLQTLVIWILLPLSFLADPARNLNWLHRVFGLEQTLMPPALFLLLRMAIDPLLVVLPTHLLLRRLLPPPAPRPGGAGA